LNRAPPSPASVPAVPGPINILERAINRSGADAATRPLWMSRNGTSSDDPKGCASARDHVSDDQGLRTYHASSPIAPQHGIDNRTPATMPLAVAKSSRFRSVGIALIALIGPAVTELRAFIFRDTLQHGRLN
jgi:hypothetical protein